jgi:hypothetical protein
MAMGGFSGGDLRPTSNQLKAYIASGSCVRAPGGECFGGGSGERADGGPGGGDSNAPSAWITAANCRITIAPGRPISTTAQRQG